SIDFDGTQLFDGSGSLFADLYQWRLDSSPITNSDGSLVNTAALAFPLNELSLQPGETYDVSLVVSDQSMFLSSTEEIRSLRVNNNSPVAGEEINVSVNEGRSVTIDIFESLCTGQTEDSISCRPFFGDIRDGETPGLLAYGAQNGTLNTNTPADGKIEFTSTQPFASGDGSFQFILTDSFNEASSPSTVTVTVTALGVPTAGNDSYTVMALSTETIPVARLLGNDNAGDGLTLRIISVSNPSEEGGTVTLDQDEISYTPPRFLTGINADSFSYTVEDDNPVGPQSSEGTVRVAIEATVTHASLLTVGGVVQVNCASGCHNGTAYDGMPPNYNDYEALRQVAISTTGSQYDSPHNAYSADITLAEPTTDTELLTSILFKNACNSSALSLTSGGTATSHTGSSPLCDSGAGTDGIVTEDDLNDLGRELLEWVRQGAPR
ncbi:MAG: hypothetical protein ACI82Z_001903, partial [Cellvibrionaceae bacterium]